MKEGDVIELGWSHNTTYVVRIDKWEERGIRGPYRAMATKDNPNPQSNEVYLFTWDTIRSINPTKEKFDIVPPVVTVALHPIEGDQRSAQVDKVNKCVHVGCHTYPFMDIAELFNATLK